MGAVEVFGTDCTGSCAFHTGGRKWSLLQQKTSKGGNSDEVEKAWQRCSSAALGFVTGQLYDIMYIRKSGRFVTAPHLLSKDIWFENFPVTDDCPGQSCHHVHHIVCKSSSRVEQ